MTDFDNFIRDRIEGVRGMWEIDSSNATDDAVIDGVIFMHNDINIVVMPTQADNAISVDIHGFVNGTLTDSHTVTVRDNT